MKGAAITIGACLVNVFVWGQTSASLSTIKVRGKKVYDMYCLSCHMQDGTGVPRLNPPLIKTKYVLGDKQKLITIVLKGSDAGIDLGGEITYKNVMAAHDFLKDQEIADVLTFVRTSFGNKGTIVTTINVKTVRAKVK